MSHTFRDDVAALFKSKPNTWIDGLTIAQIGGAYASRTRISECRTQLGMRIENRLRTVRDHAKDCPALQAWDIEVACNCDLPRRYVISEYRFTPPLDVLQAHALQLENDGLGG